eukprot:IDg10778t1
MESCTPAAENLAVFDAQRYLTAVRLIFIEVEIARRCHRPAKSCIYAILLDLYEEQ